MAPRPVPRPAGQRFRDLLHQMPVRPETAPTLRRLLPGPALRLRPGGTVPRPAPPGRVSQRPTLQAKQVLAASIRQAATHAGVAPELSVAVARAESGLNPAARSPDGKSVGAFQVTHATAAEMRRKIAAGRVVRPPGTDDVALGVGYLRYLQDLFGRNARLARGLDTVAIPDAGERRLFAIAAYNAGEGRVAGAQARVAAAGGDPTRFADVRPYLPAITKGYVDRVVAYAREEQRATAVV